MDKPTLYLSGRISSGAKDRADIEAGKENFHRHARWLRDMGFIVYNPAEDERNNGMPWEFCMKNDLTGLLTCTGIAMIPGWDDEPTSRGASTEYRIARLLKYPVYDATDGHEIADWLLHQWDDLVGLPHCFVPMSMPTVKVAGTEPASDENILEEALRLVNGPRQDGYGHPYDNWTRTARIISGILGVEVSAEQAALVMIGVKIARELNEPKRDNLVDIAGYALVARMIVEEEQERAKYDMSSDE